MAWNPLLAVARRPLTYRLLMKQSRLVERSERLLRRISRGNLGMLDLVGLPSIVVTAPGRRTGTPRSKTLQYVPDGDTLVLVGSVLAITILVGIPLALLLDQPVLGRSIVRLMVIAPFFVMPTVSALVWKNLLMHPVSGLFAWIATLFGLSPIDWFNDAPLFAIILIVSWQWLPFATLILLTALQSLDEEQKEAAEMDGAPALSTFIYITLPHLARPITVVILIETIFLLTVFAEIFVTTGGGPGLQTTNIAFLIYSQALIQFDVGSASAGGLMAVVIANVVAFFLVRIVGRNLEA